VEMVELIGRASLIGKPLERQLVPYLWRLGEIDGRRARVRVDYRKPAREKCLKRKGWEEIGGKCAARFQVKTRYTRWYRAALQVGGG
jgi:hypothetical protein